MADSATDDRQAVPANPYMGKTKEELLKIQTDAGGRDNIKDKKAYRAAWKEAPGENRVTEAAAPTEGARTVDETPAPTTAPATESPWSLVPLEELDRYPIKETYDLLTRLEKDLGIMPPEKYAHMTLPKLKAWLRKQITSDQIRAGWEAFEKRKRDEERAKRRKINLTGARLRETTERALVTLLDANDPPFVFTRGDTLVRILYGEGGRPSIEPLNCIGLRYVVERTANFCKIRENGEETVAPPPIEVIQDLRASPSWKGIPPLKEITEAPVILPDGTITTSPGYYPAIQALYCPASDLVLPEIPDRPGPEDIARAVDLLKEVIQDFPFTSEASRVNAIGTFLTAVLRPVISGPALMALFDKPQPRTGASLLADLVARVATGRPGAMMTAPTNEEEWSKTITALLLGGRTVVVIDNVKVRLSSSALEMALTADTVRQRVLGKSTAPDLPARITWMATGNNVQMGDAIAYRSYWIQIDAHMARPGERADFLHEDIRTWVLQERSRILAAILTLARAWMQAGRPKPTGIPQIGGFERWRWVIGGILQNAGLTDFLDNYNQFHERSDVTTTLWDSFLLVLLKHFPGGFSTKEVVTRLEVERGNQQRSLMDPETMLDDVLPDDIAGKKGDLRTILGKAFAKRQGQVFPSGCVLVKDEKKTHQAVYWQIKKADQK
jgi:hypothetical protein